MNRKNYNILAFIWISLTLGIASLVVSYAYESYLCDVGYDILRMLGLSLTPTGIITIILRNLLSKETSKEIRTIIKNEITKEFCSFKDLYALKEQGIDNISKRFPKNERVDDLVSKSYNRIDILNTWIPNLPDLKEAILEAVNHNCKIRLLILSDTSPLVHYRAKQLGQDKSLVINKIIDSKRVFLNEIHMKIQKEIPKYADNIQMKEYDDLFSLSVYRFDDVIYSGWFWSHENNIQAPYLKAKHLSSSQFSLAIENHFNKIWKNAKPVALCVE